MGLGYRRLWQGQRHLSLNLITDYNRVKVHDYHACDSVLAGHWIQSSWGLHGNHILWKQKPKISDYGKLSLDTISELTLAYHGVDHRLAMHAGAIKVSERWVPTAKLSHLLPVNAYGQWGVRGSFDYLKQDPTLSQNRVYLGEFYRFMSAKAQQK